MSLVVCCRMMLSHLMPCCVSCSPELCGRVGWVWYGAVLHRALIVVFWYSLIHVVGDTLSCVMLSLNSHDVVWCGVMWCDVMWCDAILYHFMWCDMMRCDAVWCDVMRCDAMQCDVVWCDAMRCVMIQCVSCFTTLLLNAPCVLHLFDPGSCIFGWDRPSNIKRHTGNSNTILHGHRWERGRKLEWGRDTNYLSILERDRLGER